VKSDIKSEIANKFNNCSIITLVRYEQ